MTVLSPHFLRLVQVVFCVCIYPHRVGKTNAKVAIGNSKHFRCAHAPYNWSKAASKEIQDQSGIRHLTAGPCLQKMEMRSNLKTSQEKTGQRSFMIIGDRAHTAKGWLGTEESFHGKFWVFSKLPAK